LANENDVIDGVNGTAKIEIEKDKMKAFIEVTRPIGAGTPCTMETVKALLAEKNVVYGIDENQISEAVKEQNWGRKILVAEGKPVQNGLDATISYSFVLPGEKLIPTINESGSVNFYEIGLVNNVSSGTLLAARTPPVLGESGFNVSGQEITPKPGKDFLLPKGKNTVSNEDGTKLFAMIDGQITVIDRKISVSPILQINSDIDFTTGNIDFIGSVIIKGNINSGFSVKAQGDIEVGGFVEAAEVIAKGNILVKSGIKAGNKGLVKAGENLSARFIENSQVEAGRDILVKDVIMQSYVRAGRSVIVSDKKATIVGGLIQATELIEAKTLGSQLATRTIFEVGVNPYYREEYQKITKVRTEKKKVMDNLNSSMLMFQRAGISPQNLPENKRVALLKVLDDYKTTKQELSDYEERITFLEEEMNRISSARVRALEVAYPGVRISIGSAVYVINDTTKFAQFIMGEGEVKLTSLT